MYLHVGEGSPSMLAKSAGAGEVAAVVQSEQAHTYNTRWRARLLQNETYIAMWPGWSKR